MDIPLSYKTKTKRHERKNKLQSNHLNRIDNY